MMKINFLSASEGKLELHASLVYHRDDMSYTQDQIVCASNDPLELANAFIKYGWEDTFRTSSSFDFGEESGFDYNEAVHDLFEKTFTVIESLT